MTNLRKGLGEDAEESRGAVLCPVRTSRTFATRLERGRRRRSYGAAQMLQATRIVQAIQSGKAGMMRGAGQVGPASERARVSNTEMVS
jgi:hypothetical protein